MKLIIRSDAGLPAVLIAAEWAFRFADMPDSKLCGFRRDGWSGYAQRRDNGTVTIVLEREASECVMTQTT